MVSVLSLKLLLLYHVSPLTIALLILARLFLDNHGLVMVVTGRVGSLPFFRRLLDLARIIHLDLDGGLPANVLTILVFQVYLLDASRGLLEHLRLDWHQQGLLPAVWRLGGDVYGGFAWTLLTCSLRPRLHNRRLVTRMRYITLWWLVHG